MPMLKGGRIAEAVPYLESLTKSAPANAEVLYNLGIAYSELGQFDEAIIRLKRAVQLDPGHAHAWVGIGTAYHRMRKPEQALHYTRQALLLLAEPALMKNDAVQEQKIALQYRYARLRRKLASTPPVRPLHHSEGEPINGTECFDHGTQGR